MPVPARTAVAPATATPATLPAAPSPSRATLRTGRALSGFVAVFLFFDGGARLAGFGPYLEGTVQFGFPLRLAPWIGLTLLISTALYALPRTAGLGAILLTGYLGGAAAAHVRVGDPWFLFPVSFAVVAWVGLYLREPRLRKLFPLRRD